MKTRLSPGLSSAAITDFYCCLLDDTLALARSLLLSSASSSASLSSSAAGDVEVAIMCPEADVNELAQLAGDGVSVVAQKGEGLASGLTSVFAHFAEGQQQQQQQQQQRLRRTIAFNSDSPHLPRFRERNAAGAGCRC